MQDGAAGMVKVEVTINGSLVTEVSILSNPRLIHAAVRASILQCKCVPVADETKAIQVFAIEVE